MLLPASVDVLGSAGPLFINTSTAWLLKLADDISKSVAHQHHRMLSFKSEEAGLSRAKAGVMRRLSMVATRSARTAGRRGATPPTEGASYPRVAPGRLPPRVAP